MERVLFKKINDFSYLCFIIFVNYIRFSWKTSSDLSFLMSILIGYIQWKPNHSFTLRIPLYINYNGQSWSRPLVFFRHDRDPIVTSCGPVVVRVTSYLFTHVLNDSYLLEGIVSIRPRSLSSVLTFPLCNDTEILDVVYVNLLDLIGESRNVFTRFPSLFRCQLRLCYVFLNFNF